MLTHIFIILDEQENTRYGKQPNTILIEFKSWMNKISGSKTVDSISIPGTHDSGADVSPAGWVGTQDMSIINQLNAGIRFLDIRCRHISNIFTIHHGSFYLNKNFDDVLQMVTQFLSQNPSEIVLMRVKEEHNPESNTRSFEETFKTYYYKYSEFFWIYNNNDNPTLDMLRRKIVVLQDFSTISTLYGLKYNSFNIQDEYSVTVIPTKQSNIRDWYRKAGKTRRIINYLSGVGAFTPSIVASYTNPYMLDLIVNNNPAYVGIIPADFPSSNLILAVIRANY